MRTNILIFKQEREFGYSYSYRESAIVVMKVKTG